MGEVVTARERLTSVSISRLAEGLRMDRKTVAKRLAESNVAPSGKRDGYPIYPFREAVEAVLETGSRSAGQDDPRDYKPTERRAYYQSENERIAMETRCRTLVPAAEVETEYAELVKGIVQFLDSLGDHLERECALTPEQIETMNKTVSAQRQALYNLIVVDDAEQQHA